MNSLSTILASLALVLPVSAGGGLADIDRVRQSRAVPLDGDVQGSLGSVSTAPLPILQQSVRTPERRQVHIERRVIIRIAPNPAPARAASIEEVPSGACIPVDSIAGVRPADGNRLLLFLRDSRVLSAQLDRSCNAQDFYPGFYLERSDDGRLCRSRDWLQSRAGANCQITGFSRLVASRD